MTLLGHCRLMVRRGPVEGEQVARIVERYRSGRPIRAIVGQDQLPRDRVALILDEAQVPRQRTLDAGTKQRVVDR
jgi:hypothetical protein